MVERVLTPQILNSRSCENGYATREQRSVESKIKSFAEATPSVNLQSWSERPRRHVSIKTDRDYVFGGVGQGVGAEPCVADPKADDLSRVPVVTAVEFKKPYTPPSRVTVNEGDHSRRKSSTIVVVGEPSAGCRRNGSSTRLWSSEAVGDGANVGRITSFTFREYKNKLASKEKSSPKKGRRSFGQD